MGSAGEGGFSRLKPRGFGPTNIVSHCGLDCRVARQSDAMMHKEADGADELVGLPRDNPHRQFLARQMRRTARRIRPDSDSSTFTVPGGTSLRYISAPRLSRQIPHQSHCAARHHSRYPPPYPSHDTGSRRLLCTIPNALPFVWCIADRTPRGYLGRATHAETPRSVGGRFADRVTTCPTPIGRVG